MSLSTPSPILPTALAEAFHVLGSTTDRTEAVESTFRLVDSALGVPAISVRLLIPDPTGRLRLVSERQGLEDVGRKRSARRREAVATKRACIIHLRKPAGASLAIVPLVYRDEVFGVLEVAARGSVIGKRLEALEIVGTQAAIVLRNVDHIEEVQRIEDASVEVARLMRELLDAPSREHAVGIVVRFLWSTMKIPVAGWLRGTAGQGPKLVGTRGIARDVRNSLESSGDEPWEIDAIVGLGSELLGGATPIVTSAGDALVMVSGVSESPAGLFRVVEASLSLALDRLALRDAMQELSGSIDAGLAWTAHEIRAPLLGVEKAIEQVASQDRMGDDDRRLLKRAQADLHRLTTTVDGLLRWSVGAAAIHRRRTDLTRLVTETVRSLTLEDGGRRISVDLPDKAVVSVDPVLLRIAVANLVRNSLEHGGDGVEVTLDITDRDATLSVSDRGSGIPYPERTTVFQPFVRGRGAPRGGQGLGLFITQRIVQAHGGDLWLESGVGGPVFRIRIPAGAA